MGRSLMEIGGCPSAQPESVAAAIRLLDHPPEIPQFSGPDKFARGRQFSAWLRDQEQKLGASTPERDRELFTDLEIALHQQNETRPFSEYESVLRGVLGQIGITLEIGPEDDTNYSVDTPSPNELETYAAKFQALWVARMFSSIPIELSRTLGIKKVVFGADSSLKSSPIDRFSGLAVASDGTLIIDITSIEDQDWGTAQHEIYHFVDASWCKVPDTRRDPAYAKLNHSAEYNDDEWPLSAAFASTQPPRFTNQHDQYLSMYAVARAAQKDNNVERYSEVKRQADAIMRGIEMYSDYSHFNPAEDKAELGSNIFDEWHYDDLLNPESPVLKAKFIELFARLYQVNPDVARFYALRYATVCGACRPAS